MGYIQNFEALAETNLRADALSIAEAGYGAVSVPSAIKRRVTLRDDTLRIDDARYPLAGRRLFFIGVGKCAFAAARAVEKSFGERLADGIALAPLEAKPLTGRGVSAGERANLKLKTVKTYVGTHPLPSDVNVEGATKMVEFLEGLSENDLVLVLISGGGSTLLCLPEAPATCFDETVLFKALTAKGATIQEINTVRKHFSRARGGGLARAAYPAEIVSLVVSDVPGDAISFVSSGPTARDTSTVADARAVLAKYGVAVPVHVEFIETPKDERYFKRVANVLFLSSQDALSAMREEAEARGYTVTIADSQFSGEASDIGRSIVEALHYAPEKTALLYAGESTLTLSDGAGAGPSTPVGAGGRNQEVALAALAEVRDGELVLPFASDGRDNSDYAGAIADTRTREHASARGLSIEEHLSSHSTYNFFSTTGDALSTGYTEANVSDLIIALKNASV